MLTSKCTALPSAFTRSTRTPSWPKNRGPNSTWSNTSGSQTERYSQTSASAYSHRSGHRPNSLWLFVSLICLEEKRLNGFRIWHSAVQGPSTSSHTLLPELQKYVHFSSTNLLSFHLEYWGFFASSFNFFEKSVNNKNKPCVKCGGPRSLSRPTSANLDCPFCFLDSCSAAFDPIVKSQWSS